MREAFQSCQFCEPTNFIIACGCSLHRRFSGIHRWSAKATSHLHVSVGWQQGTVALQVSVQEAAHAAGRGRAHKRSAGMQRWSAKTTSHLHTSLGLQQGMAVSHVATHEAEHFGRAPTANAINSVSSRAACIPSGRDEVHRRANTSCRRKDAA